jgi:predicted transcriptional regulator
MTRYPYHSGHQVGSSTSEAAARHVDENGSADSQLFAVETYLLTTAKYKGATADEIRQVAKTNWPHLHNSIVSARLSRLVNMGKVVKTVKTRKASTGRPQAVYIHVDFSDMETVKPLQSTTKKKDFLADIEPMLRAMFLALDAGKTPRLEPGGPFHNKLKEHFQ